MAGHSVSPVRCLQAFSLLHSMGGGTGSGLGSYVLEALADEYPRTIRFATAVFPSESDDVVTSPYNTVLAAAELAAPVTAPSATGSSMVEPRSAAVTTGLFAVLIRFAAKPAAPTASAL